MSNDFAPADTVWDAPMDFDDCDEDLMGGDTHNIVNEIDDDLFMLDDEDNIESSLGGLEDDGNVFETNKLPPIYNEAPRSPPPRVVSNNMAPAPAKVSPQSAPVRGVRRAQSTPLPQMTELQRQYQQTVKKLAKSMRQSDATRRIVQRQRSDDGSSFFVQDTSSDFFLSDRCRELEDDRKRLFRMINY